jgi:multiple sugar transport system permease protein|tara:strand:+ start:151 stop:1014 length:864 start_codon:yes stop_codon:yes gene_type:complete
MRALRWLFVGGYFCVAMLPLCWLLLTSFKVRDESITVHPKFIPTLAATVAPDDPYFRANLDGYRQLAAVYAGANRAFLHYLGNSLLIGLFSTACSVLIGTCAAYGFSRFNIPGSKDWLFFILSTRFLPPLAVVVPVLMMYREFDLQNSHLGLILLYTAFNMSLAVWLMKGFIDEIPTAYEEAALVDGYTRLQAFRLIILPRAASGMAVTAVFCLISAWNEYGFAMTLNNQQAVTVPVYFAGLQGNVHGLPWPQIGAGVLLFVAPIIVFTALVRKHLLRGVTFGTIKH